MSKTAYRVKVTAVQTGYLFVYALNAEQAAALAEEQCTRRSYDDILFTDVEDWEVIGEPEEAQAEEAEAD